MFLMIASNVDTVGIDLEHIIILLLIDFVFLARWMFGSRLFVKKSLDNAISLFFDWVDNCSETKSADYLLALF